MRFGLESGASVRYNTRGRGRTIVLLHPVGLRAEFWDGVVSELENEFRLICLDARGHGESEAPHGPFELDDLARDVVEFIRVLGQPPCVVVGCSMGGMTAQGVGLIAPELVAGVVIANAMHKMSDEGRAAMQGRAEAALGGMPVVLETTLTRWFDEEAQRQHPGLVEKARNWLLASDPVVHSWSWLAIKNLNYARQLTGLKPPALAIAGTGDRATSETAVREMAQDIPDCRFRDIKSGHLAPLERPAEFAALLREFLGELAPAQARA